MTEDERVQWLAYDHLRTQRIDRLAESLKNDKGEVLDGAAYVALMMERF